MDGLADVLVDPTPLADRRHNGGEVVVGEDHIRGRTGHLCAVFPHGAADIRSLQGWRVVDTVAGHGNHHPPALEGFDDLHPVSYTHLDVYKRQKEMDPIWSADVPLKNLLPINRLAAWMFPSLQ